MVQESMGEIVERSLEHLVSSDLAVVRTRRRMLRALQEFQTGTAPPGVDSPDVYRAWSGFLTAPADADWQQVYTDHLPFIRA
jgi:hypothetical protein